MVTGLAMTERGVGNAKAEKAVLAWADHCGLHSDTAPPGRSWAPKRPHSSGESERQTAARERDIRD
ncbi:hypothetical protein [Streptomyces aurantiogriseus]|uniref:Uncharacterized protein n=1 Tax=Streptomyces aurantiogriseus TaxID=66870 RepID=A0A918FLY4_9ACTN|nr:hypothetical protein [Streptomyces aurantiogriseus]GGR52019.1 hypothetical protein GCM10010251_81360 [Streptomyces aurantiogriseus]